MTRAARGFEKPNIEEQIAVATFYVVNVIRAAADRFQAHVRVNRVAAFANRVQLFIHCRDGQIDVHAQLFGAGPGFDAAGLCLAWAQLLALTLERRRIDQHVKRGLGLADWFLKAHFRKIIQWVFADFPQRWPTIGL